MPIIIYVQCRLALGSLYPKKGAFIAGYYIDYSYSNYKEIHDCLSDFSQTVFASLHAQERTLLDAHSASINVSKCPAVSLGIKHHYNIRVSVHAGAGLLKAWLALTIGYQVQKPI